MALSPEQKSVLAAILKVARQRGASPKEVKAAVETGVVESNLRNLSGGDADSAGWRQERASLYPDPTNLTASINRFFDETGAVKGKYGTAGALAAAVQRPRAEFRGRYQDQSSFADQLIGRQVGKPTPSGSPSSSAPSATTSTVGGVDNSGARRAATLAFLNDKSSNPVDFALQIRGLADVPGQKVTTTSDSGAPARSSSGSPGLSQGQGPLKELFWQGQGGIDVKNGVKQPQGFVSGHTDHVHVASGPRTVIALGKLAQSLGLHVGENPYFTGQSPVPGVHVTDSNHYKIKVVNGKKVGEAIDVSGDPKAMAHYAALVAHRYGLKVKG